MSFDFGVNASSPRNDPRLLVVRLLCHGQGMSSTHDRLEPVRRLARALPGGMALGRWLRRLFNPELRTIHQLIRTERGRLFQPFPDTWDERYPTLFDALAERLAGLPEPRILSFGCSSGAEVRALRSRLPQARITGIDLNPRALAKARRDDPHPLSSYQSTADPAGRFDAVFALAVFRHGKLESDRPDDCSPVLAFGRFEQGVAALDACLVPGGWLAIHHSHFRFTDTFLACRYRAEPADLPEITPTEVLYGPDNRRLAGAELLPVLFRKLAEPDPAPGSAT